MLCRNTRRIKIGLVYALSVMGGTTKQKALDNLLISYLKTIYDIYIHYVIIHPNEIISLDLNNYVPVYL